MECEKCKAKLNETVEQDQEQVIAGMAAAKAADQVVVCKCGWQNHVDPDSPVPAAIRTCDDCGASLAGITPIPATHEMPTWQRGKVEL